ncbi:PIR protein [Plasmodium yoelii]|uniref:PIR protein n=2 Tax=Plasmodium yoelii TaxID=5861 RepID=A0AAF0B3H3_PLAYO|nr:PIR protein [Plasmodium yoelii]WBY58363.1 PIR protein [Plasmodium yoelii yoelii]CDU18694.1 YIR protein [Plasmodium yoelii]VTZ79279.1 PIR protein [Plasmodium yoelii]|eukprot:XP_034493554.1 PIR protein [Plasmodium yoelii]
MNDDLCGKFIFLRTYLPDDLSDTPKSELKDHEKFKKYCPNTNSGKNECDNDLGKITAGFLWLLEECYSAFKNKTNENSINAFFMHMISWFSYKLKQKSVSESTKIYDYYTKHVIDSGKYNEFTNSAYKFTELKDFIEERKDLLNINIQNLSKFYDAFKLLCSIYGDISTNTNVKNLSDNANEFVKKYQELNAYSNNTDDSTYRQILSSLSTNYDHLKTKCKNDQPLPEITANIYALTSGETSSSSSGTNKLLTVLSIFGAIAFFLGISYKYSLFGFRKRAQKQYLKEKIKNIKKKMNH